MIRYVSEATGDIVAAVRRDTSDGVLRLAYHAALPVVIDADLLNLLRVNFFLDPPDVLPFTAEADLLLSPLFREIGNGLYGIEPEVRNVLLIGLQTRYGSPRIRQVALLLEQYTDCTPAWNAQPELEQAQRLTALSFVNPARAKAWLKDARSSPKVEVLGREWFVAMRQRLAAQARVTTVSREVDAAISRLLDDRPKVRLSAVRTLGALAQLPDADPSPIVTALADLVRNRGSTKSERVGPDVQAALSLIGVLPGGNLADLTSVTTAFHPWGRVDVDGTVYVRTADGERVIGSWQAGSPEEALAFFQRKYEALETEVVLLEQRISATDLEPAQAAATVQRLITTISDANALGDLDRLRARLERLTEDVGHRREEAKATREQARAQAKQIKERIVAEAEQIAAEATHWKSSGERMRELIEEWKAAPHADRAAEAVLWKRLSAARNAFTKKRKAYFATLEAEREDVKARKEQLCAEAEALSGSTDWGPTTSAFRELMRKWKAAGRADREAEAELWKRFRAAQDKFFTARSEVFSAKDAALREHAEDKQLLLDQAQALLPVTDIRAARSALRGIQERWEQIGAVPRDSREHLESGLRRVEEAVRKAEETQWRRSKRSRNN